MKIVFAFSILLTFCELHAQDIRTYLDSTDYYWEREIYNKAWAALNVAKEAAERAYEAEEENGAFNYGFVLNEAGMKLLVAEDYETCITFFATSADLFEEAEGENTPNRFTSLENLAITYERKGDYFTALFWYDYLLQKDAYRSYKGDLLPITYNSAGVAAQLSNLRDDAYIMYEKGLQALSPEHPNYWAIMKNLLILERDFASGAASAKYQDAYFEKFPESIPDFSNLIAYRYRENALDLIEANDYRGAIEPLELVLENLVPNDSISNIVNIYSTQDLTLSYVNTSQFSKALPLALKNEQMAKDYYGEQTDDYLYALNYLTLIYTELADYKAADKVYQKAYRILKNYEADSKGEITALFDSNYGELMVKLGKYKTAKQYAERSINFYAQDKAYFDDMIYSLNLSGLVLTAQGEYEKAEGLLKQTLKFHEQARGLENEMATKIATNLTGLYIETGRYSRALKFVDFILANDLANHGDESFEYSFSLQVAGTLYLSMGASEQGIKALKKAYAIRKPMVNSDNRELLRLRQTLGTAYYKGGKYKEAKALLEETLAIQRSTLGNQNTDVAMTVNDLGMVLFATKKYEESADLFQEGLKIRKKALGSYNQFTSASLFNLASASYLTKRKDKSLEYFKESISNALYVLDEIFPHLSQKERLEYYHTIKGQLTAYFSFLNELLDERPELASELFNVQIRTKAMLLNESMELRNYLDSQDDPLIKQAYSRWTEINQEVAKLEQFNNEGDQKIYLDSLKIVGEEYERILNALPKKVSSKSVQWQDIAATLQDEEVAIEIIRITPFDFENNKHLTEKRQYLALIIDNKTTDFPKYVRLENGTEMDSKLFNLYKNKIKFKLTDTDSHKNFWAPIAKELDGYSKVYVSSDGVYHLLNLNTLYDAEKDTYVIEDWDIEVMGNTKELINRSPAKSFPEKAILFGFPNFNSIADNETTDTERTSVFREIFTDGVSDLPGTKVEVENIDGLMNKKGIGTTSYLADHAHEAQLKNIESTDILHIATHGFFEESSDDLVNDDPLLHSGLLLANLKESISPNEENGIITAKEIAQLNLQNNKLVVLSACETGKGKVVDGQGVYGLQRAFQVAGAQNVIISLWKVDDEATKELMTLFYEFYLDSNDPRESLKKAQIKLKESFPEPIYWGAFYVIGE